MFSGEIALSNSRLSIIDLESGTQPFYQNVEILLVSLMVKFIIIKN